MQRIIQRLFGLVFFLLPLIFYPWTSEVFEFNKIVFVYAATILIVGAWIARMILAQKTIFRRTILDIPLLIFLASQLISTLFSLDLRTSLLGYYSRFNGGLLSLVSYALLYWAFVANLEKKSALRIISHALLPSAFIVSLYGLLEHFGRSPSCLLITGRFDADCWVQKVSERVFATLGQPNWLAAFLVACIPLAWYQALGSKTQKQIVSLAVACLFFAVLLFTKSRSGLLGFGAAWLFFWLPGIRKNWKPFAAFAFVLAIPLLSFGSPLTPSLRQLFEKAKPPNRITSQSPPSGPALEEGGTESGEIRKIVWKGALEIAKHYPLFGSGVETFAFSYWKFRPIEHNNTSEWDFIYNKAHNEYLNFLANTGFLGLAGYLTLIGFSLYQILKTTGDQNHDLKMALFAGYGGILVTNFFGFSVVPVSLLTFLFPALAVVLTDWSAPDTKGVKKLSSFQKIALALLVLLVGYLLLLVGRWWYADFLWAKAKMQGRTTDYNQKISLLGKAIAISPNEALYRSELAQAYATVAVLLSQNTTDDKQQVEAAIQKTSLGAINQIDMASRLSPNNPNILRGRANVFSDLSLINRNYLQETIKTFEALATLAPTDPSVYYKLALATLATGQKEKAIAYLTRATALKPDYGPAKEKLQYLLKNTAK